VIEEADRREGRFKVGRCRIFCGGCGAVEREGCRWDL